MLHQWHSCCSSVMETALSPVPLNQYCQSSAGSFCTSLISLGDGLATSPGCPPPPAQWHNHLIDLSGKRKWMDAWSYLTWRIHNYKLPRIVFIGIYLSFYVPGNGITVHLWPTLHIYPVFDVGKQFLFFSKRKLISSQLVGCGRTRDF